MFTRNLNLKQFKHSFFLFGPRQVGKTFLIQSTLTPDLFIDLLDQGEHIRYLKDVSLLSREVSSTRNNAPQIVIDEIQRCPELLNEVQLIMGKLPQAQFILTGSSARKLKRTGANLLGGRAMVLHLYPLTYDEMGELFFLEDAIRFGSMPYIVLEKNKEEKARLLRGYVETYLREEIQQESLTRNIPAFAKFLELAAFENGNTINFQSFAREIGIHSKTIKDYFQILEDTLLGFFCPPYTGSHRKRIISHPRFYFFDCGAVTALKGELTKEIATGTVNFGKAFERFILLEVKKQLVYKEREAKMSFFRTSDGAEVDLILELNGEVWAIEIKSSSTPAPAELRGLRSFIKDHKHNRALCVCQTPRPFSCDGIDFIPWQDFLRQL